MLSFSVLDNGYESVGEVIQSKLRSGMKKSLFINSQKTFVLRCYCIPLEIDLLRI